MRGLSFVPSIISLSKLRRPFIFFFYCRLNFALKSPPCHGASQCFVPFIPTHIITHRFIFYYRLSLPPVTCVYLCIFLITCFSCSGAAICRIPCKVIKKCHSWTRTGVEKARPQRTASGSVLLDNGWHKRERGDGSKNGVRRKPKGCSDRGELALWYVGYRVTAGQRAER